MEYRLFGQRANMGYRASTAGTANATTLVLTIPASTQVGDHMIIGWASQDGYTLTNPSGWTEWKNAANGNERYRVLTRIAQAGDAGSTVTLTTSTANKMSAILGVASDIDTTNPIATEAPSENAVNTASTTWANPSTTLTADRFCWSFILTRAATATITSITKPTVWTQVQSALQGISGDTCAALAYKDAVAGPIGGDVWTTSSSTARAVTFVVPLAATPPPEPTTVTGIWDGTQWVERDRIVFG